MSSVETTKSGALSTSLPEIPAGAGGRRAWFAAIAVAASLWVWTAWLYCLPPGYDCWWGVNPLGGAHFRRVLHLPSLVVDSGTFRAGFVACLAFSWVTYLSLLSLGLASAGPPIARVRRLATGTVLAVAALGPPALSSDVYAYVGYARLAVVHHLSPYAETQVTLVHLGDPTGPFLRWPIASPYGPLWTIVSMVVVFVLPKSSLLAPILVFKGLGAAGVLAIAEAGRRLARRVSSGREELVFAALALNPLFVIEGVANAHNDVVMMALVMWAFVFATEERWKRAFLLLGVASSIKFIPLLLGPWFLVGALRAAPLETMRRKLVVAARAFALTTIPILASYAPFWRGVETLEGLRSRSHHGTHPMNGGFVQGAVVVLTIWGGLTPWVARAPLARAARGWIVVSLAVVMLLSGMWFPWYFVWPWAVALVLLERANLVFTGIVWGAVLLSLWSYVR
ncbi:MAG: hypothetical protein JWM82_724 [Myxococcales bacterium]|nr:hypothetical protein [Myxococcales bacterium]